LCDTRTNSRGAAEVQPDLQPGKINPAGRGPGWVVRGAALTEPRIVASGCRPGKGVGSGVWESAARSLPTPSLPPRPDGRPRARRIHRDAGALSATDGLRDRPQLWLGAEVDGPTSPKEVEGPHPGGPRTPSEPSAARDWATLEKVRPPYTRRAVSAFRKPPRVAPHRKPCQQSSYRNVRKSYIH